MGKCYFCGAPLEGPQYRTSACPSCGKDSKICMNCSFYSKGSHWDCRESISEAVLEKERTNFCDFFRLGDNYKSNNKDKSASIDAFNKLFSD